MKKPQPSPEELKAIGLRIKQGDKEAFHFLYRHYFDSLQEYAMRYVYDYQDAQDIVQDAFLSLWVNTDQYDPSRNIVTYLLVIVKNACINHLRNLKIRDSHRDKIVEAMLFSNLEDPETDPELQKRLQHIVRRKKISVIAEEMGIAESTVKTHLKRTLKTLRENLLFILIGI